MAANFRDYYKIVLKITVKHIICTTKIHIFAKQIFNKFIKTMKKITLFFALFAILVGSAIAQKGLPSIGKAPQSEVKTLNSTITATSVVYIPGTTVDLSLDYNHITPDDEWVDGISLTFPAGVTVNSSADFDLTWNSETGDGVETTWGDMAGGSGGGPLSANASWTVNITIDAGFTGDLAINWSIAGDGYGAEPHTAAGVITLTEAVAADLSVIAATPSYVFTGNSATPVVTVMNNGSTTQDVFDITVVINDGASDVYTSTKNVAAAGLLALTSADYTMDDEWTTPVDGNYTITATVTLVGDANNANDELSIDCFVGSFYEAQAGNATDLTYTNIVLADGTETVVGVIATDPFPMAEEFDGTNIYRVYNDSTYGTVNALGEYTAVGTFSGVAGTPSALAYDHTNGVMYACLLDASNLPQLCTADMATGVLTLVGTGTEGMIIAMDFANDGMLYGPDLGDNLYQIDPATGAVTVVGPIGIDINYGQDVSYDFEVNRLYTLSCGSVYEFGYYDLATGAFNSIADMSGDQYGTFVITKVPVGPLDLSVTPLDMAIDVAIDATVAATFHTNIFETDFSGITITPDPGNVTASIVDNVLTIAHDDLAYETEYTVTIPMGSINDGSDDLVFDVIWSFTTMLDPTACNDPSDALFSDITAFTATVAWTENGPATEWNVIYGAQGFDPLTEGTTIVATTTPTADLTSLTATTDYDVYIQAVCGVGIESTLVGPFQFMTGCDVATELDEGFETAVPPLCWDTFQGGAGTRVWEQSDANPLVGTYSAYANFENSGGANEQWLVTGVITVPDNYSLTFDVTDDYASDYSSTLVIKATTDGGTTYSDLLTIAEADVTADTYSHFVVDVAAYGSTDTKFAFVMMDDDGDNWFLDNVKLEFVSEIEDIANNLVNIYPNPSTGLVNITATENSTIKVVDIAGRIVEEFSVNAFEEINFTQSAGMYVVQVESNGNASTHKLIIK